MAKPREQEMKTANSASPEAIEPSREQIELLAYAIWESRHGHGGSAEEDWFEAERRLRDGSHPTFEGPGQTAPAGAMK